MAEELNKGQEREKPAVILSELKKNIPEFKVGDTVKVYVKIKEGEDKFRLQPFEGIVIRKRGKGIAASITVRKVSFGEGVERVFSLHAPTIEKLEIVKSGKVSKAKLYYLRDKKGKAYKVEDQEASTQQGN